MNCGAELLARAVFCTSCGKAVGAAPEKPPAEHVMTGLASYGDRVAAWLIDSVIVYGAAIVVLAIIIAVYLPDTASSEAGQTGVGFVLVPIVPLWEGRRRALHDLAAGTIFITRRTNTQ